MNAKRLMETLCDCMGEGEHMEDDLVINMDSDVADVTQLTDTPGVKSFGNLTGRVYVTITFTTQSDSRITHKI